MSGVGCAVVLVGLVWFEGAVRWGVLKCGAVCVGVWCVSGAREGPAVAAKSGRVRARQRAQEWWGHRPNGRQVTEGGSPRASRHASVRRCSLMVLMMQSGCGCAAGCRAPRRWESLFFA